jgi:hypothetical protein
MTPLLGERDRGGRREDCQNDSGMESSGRKRKCIEWPPGTQDVVRWPRPPMRGNQCCLANSSRRELFG